MLIKKDCPQFKNRPKSPFSGTSRKIDCSPVGEPGAIIGDGDRKS